MSRNGKIVMLRTKNKYKKQETKVTHFIQPQKASKGLLHYQARLGESYLDSLSSFLQRRVFFNGLLVILTVKERDKLNSEGSWFVLLSAPFNCTKETSAMTLKNILSKN